MNKLDVTGLVSLHQILLIAYLVGSVAVFVSLMFGPTAAYGRHDSRDKAWWWGPGIPTRWSWVIMEAPSSLGFALIFFLGDRALEPAPLVLLLMWQAHYFHRTFIYPFLRRLKPGDSTPLLIPASGFFTNIGVAFLNAAILSWSALGPGYDQTWLTDPRFLVGLIVFVAGFHINRRADAMLAALRKPGETGYKIPRGWLYEKISCPNYFGEILIWTGWAIATWSLAGVVFVLWTAANLVPRALAHHRWYREKFTEYPAQRRAVIPGLV